MPVISTKIKTVLIADDEPHIARVLKLSVEGAGCRVATVGSGQAALRKAATDPIDLLVVDIAMPGMDGFETVSLLRQKPGYETLPVIVLTGSGDHEFRLQAESLGVSVYLTKPFSPAELQRRVRSLLAL